MTGTGSAPDHAAALAGPSAPAMPRLRVGVVAPPWFEVPPAGYGGIEWICYWLVEGLASRGHQVTLVAAGDQHANARFLSTLERPPSGRVGQALPELLHAALADRLLAGLDLEVVHDHSAAGPLTALGRRIPTVVTAHGTTEGEPGRYYRAIADRVALVAISEAQRRRLPELAWAGVVHNGIPVAQYPYRVEKDDFALFLGRMGPDKGAHRAIAAARAAGVPLILAAKCREPAELAYFEQEIRPQLGSEVTWVGEADTATKKELLARARCLLFPVRWQEPFGIVLVEALACGTPVVALAGGAVTEILTHGRTGLVTNQPEDLPALLAQVGRIDPAACRQRAWRFDVAVMVAGYEAIYARLARAADGAAA
jgi:glycosyltransferase involved in cell wall biosynthesis